MLAFEHFSAVVGTVDFDLVCVCVLASVIARLLELLDIRRTMEAGS
jgi:hypothetical protein